MNEEVKQQVRKGRGRKDEEQPQEVSSNSQEVSSNSQEVSSNSQEVSSNSQETPLKSGREVKLSNGLTVTYH